MMNNRQTSSLNQIPTNVTTATGNNVVRRRRQKKNPMLSFGGHSRRIRMRQANLRFDQHTVVNGSLVTVAPRVPSTPATVPILMDSAIDHYFDSVQCRFPVALHYHIDREASNRRLIETNLRNDGGLWSHQIEAADFMTGQLLKNMGGLFLDTMRLGKTRAAGLFMFEDIQRRVGKGQPRFAQPFVVVCEVSLVHVWYNELNKLISEKEKNKKKKKKESCLYTERENDEEEEEDACTSVHNTVPLLSIGIMTNQLRGKTIDTTSVSSSLSSSYNIPSHAIIPVNVWSKIDELVSTYDIIIVTYSILCISDESRSKCPFHDLPMRALLMDEADILRNSDTYNYKFISSLKVPIKWYISGTPLHNNISDLISAMRLVHIPLSAQPTVQELRKALSQHAIRRSIAEYDLDDFLIKATKLVDWHHQPDRDLYVNAVQSLVRSIYLESTVKSTSSSSSSSSRYTIDGTSVSTTNVFSIISTIRILCSSVYLLNEERIRSYLPNGMKFFSTAPHVKPGTIDTFDEDRFTSPYQLISWGAYHTMLVHALGIPLTYVGNHIQYYLNKYAHQFDGNLANLSEMVATGIDELWHRMISPISSLEIHFLRLFLDKIYPSGEKFVVFTHWLRQIDRFQWLFKLLAYYGRIKRDEYIVVYHGKVSLSDRGRPLELLTNDPACIGIIVTPQVGRAGLDIAAANHVILFNPWWNPQQHKQAISRILGINQKRKPHFYRLGMRDSIDEDIIAEADEKLKLAQRYLATPSNTTQTTTTTTTMTSDMMEQATTPLNIINHFLTPVELTEHIDEMMRTESDDNYQHLDDDAMIMSVDDKSSMECDTGEDDNDSRDETMGRLLSRVIQRLTGKATNNSDEIKSKDMKNEKEEEEEMIISDDDSE